MKNVKVAMWGIGAMGGGIARVLLNKKGVDIVGVCDTHPERLHKNAFDVLDVAQGQREDIPIRGDIDEVILEPGFCDVCVIATDSFVEKVYEKILRVVKKGVNVITLAEEMACPSAQHPEL
ncbi:NADP-binding protein, partial [Christensenellaceae bacterium OttesenSCG-928-M15]|nr:NADP-binding protein [Christensenellaceae bacterium OttesenSCG-928-M15]